MYKKILVALDHTEADASLIPQVSKLAHLCGAELLLVHVADGWVARNYDLLNLAESEEMREDRAYLDEIATRLGADGLAVRTQLALGDPPSEILKTSVAEKCDLIAMTTHGHR